MYVPVWVVSREKASAWQKILKDRKMDNFPEYKSDVILECFIDENILE